MTEKTITIVLKCKDAKSANEASRAICNLYPMLEVPDPVSVVGISEGNGITLMEFMEAEHDQ